MSSQSTYTKVFFKEWHRGRWLQQCVLACLRWKGRLENADREGQGESLKQGA